MDNAALIAASRLIAQENAMDIRANNIANANTPGFRATRMQFDEYLAKQDAALTAQGGGTISYTQGGTAWRDRSTGPITQTGNPLDLAINGDGYFEVQTANGVRLTRDGHFTLGSDGTISDDQGDALLDSNGAPLQLSATDINPVITGDGTISGAAGAIGKIGVVTPDDPTALQAEGGTLFNPTGTTTPVAAPKILQGALEGSNVEPIAETTAMMTDEREFQFVAEFVEAEGQREQDAIDKLTAPAST